MKDRKALLIPSHLSEEENKEVACHVKCYPNVKKFSTVQESNTESPVNEGRKCRCIATEICGQEVMSGTDNTC